MAAGVKRILDGLTDVLTDADACAALPGAATGLEASGPRREGLGAMCAPGAPATPFGWSRLRSGAGEACAARDRESRRRYPPHRRPGGGGGGLHAGRGLATPAPPRPFEGK